ncbi:NAD(P)H-dependent oxidoreductase [Kitasatospora atroaurantiaca]|uniref:FMN dependent NADH:quinone oxidoreductase n=1 Tax=Kitasatospora atroaurantiaca TaxID=285545 RepID=A0A561ESH5_9ACTN|nr:NAD(P)H-dependent oxidoreductase [Kitasatospora atroaurantiaca]TWE18555.1 FMN-dependent NADH-azoreductase [Kitasatospora atroaurantiaca]
MSTLLHIDSSALTEGSVSREVSATFRKEWEAQNPEGTVIYRDLAATPVPHLSADGITASYVPAEHRTPEQQAALALREELISELEQADAVVIGTPMYNFTIPSSLKAWLDQVILMGRTAGEQPSAAGTSVTVVSARGGSYAAGTPRESFEFVTTYLEKVLTGMLGLEVDFVLPEFTLARVNPALADFIDTADASKAQAHQDAVEKAKALSAKLAA